MNTENTNAAKELPKVLTFGENNEWAVHHDDGCLIFHPQWNTNPHKTSIWIWKEAWEFVQNKGGFDRLVSWFRDTEIKGGHTELKEEIDKFKKELDNSKFGAQCSVHELEYDRKTLIRENLELKEEIARLKEEIEKVARQNYDNGWSDYEDLGNQLIKESYERGFKDGQNSYADKPSK